MLMDIDYTQIILALIAGIPAMLAALATLLVTLRGNKSIKESVINENAKCSTDVKEIVKQEAIKTAAVAQDVKDTLVDENHKRELRSQENAIKLNELVKTTDKIKADVNGNLTNLLQTSTDALVKAVELSSKNAQQAVPMLPQTVPRLPQEIKISADSEIRVVE